MKKIKAKRKYALVMNDVCMGSYYNDKYIRGYLKDLKHTDKCTRIAPLKKAYHKEDQSVGEAHIDGKDYIIYSCYECGGFYYKEGLSGKSLLREEKGG